MTEQPSHQLPHASAEVSTAAMSSMPKQRRTTTAKKGVADFVTKRKEEIEKNIGIFFRGFRVTERYSLHVKI